VAQRTYQIGEVTDRVGLSLRTVRYYEEVGLVAPSDRTAGGFRLYTEVDIERLIMAKELKPLGFSLDEVRTVLDLVTTAEEARTSRPSSAPPWRSSPRSPANATTSCVRSSPRPTAWLGGSRAPWTGARSRHAERAPGSSSWPV
jgi:DNA-binding transcriptional MerR regulator